MMLRPDWSAFEEEAKIFAAFLSQLSESDFARETPCFGWTVADIVRHLGFLDNLAVIALNDAALFEIERNAFLNGRALPDEIASHAPAIFAALRDYQERKIGTANSTALIDHWHSALEPLANCYAAIEPSAKVEWFGPSMKAQSLIAARHMELWSYGQDAYDALGQSRTDGDRLRYVIEFGLRTFRFSFANRGLAVPPAVPAIMIVSPSGASWEWNSDNSADRIEGSAVDFALVVTQRRHLHDTGLKVKGTIARQWMAISQCIAAPPIDGPRPCRKRPSTRLSTNRSEVRAWGP